MLPVTPEDFEEAVSAALDAVPPPLMAMLDNVAFFVEEEPPQDQPGDLLGIPALIGWTFEYFKGQHAN